MNSGWKRPAQSRAFLVQSGPEREADNPLGDGVGHGQLAGRPPESLSRGRGVQWDVVEGGLDLLGGERVDQRVALASVLEQQIEDVGVVLALVGTIGRRARPRASRSSKASQ
jgi:hypothetical protein